MKKIIVTALLMAGLFVNAQGFQYKIVTTIESVVPGGIGRSRIIENGTEVDYTQFTTTELKKEKRKLIKTEAM